MCYGFIRRALVKINEETKINIFVTHFSYIQQIQCLNAFQLQSFVNKFSGSTFNNKILFNQNLFNYKITSLRETHESYPFDLEVPKIMLGDFNTYNDFEIPIEYLTKKPSPKHPSKPNNDQAKNGEQFNSVHQQNSAQNAIWCHTFFQNQMHEENEKDDEENEGEWIDAWAEMCSEKPGFTFSNMVESQCQIKNESDSNKLKYIIQSKLIATLEFNITISFIEFSSRGQVLSVDQIAFSIGSQNIQHRLFLC
jgi:hypothetical protein